MQNRAWSTLEIKAVDDEQRIIEGVASTPTPDDSGHVMVPDGAQFKLPMPLKWEHKESVGEVFAARVTPDGIFIKARFSRLAADAPASLRERIETAWHSVKAQPPLVRGFSIGWVPVAAEPIKGTTHIRFTKWLWRETSTVSIPMNSESTILAVKSFDLAASGPHPAGVSALPVVFALKDAPAMTFADQIKQFEATRAAKWARVCELQKTASDAGRSKEPAEKEEFDTLNLEIKSIDAELVDLRAMEKTNVANATKIENVVDIKSALEVRSSNPVITVKANVPPGTAWTRYVMAKVAGKNSVSDAIRFVEGNKQWMDQTPEVLLALKAAVNPGTIAEPAWAAPLAVQRPMQDEWLELLRPETLLGKIPGLKRVPFNVSVPVQTGGGTYGWVGEGGVKPVGNLQLSSQTLGIAKAAGIIVISEELAKISSPSAEGVVRADMIAGMAQYLDQQFIDPTVAAVTNVSPASITNGANGFGSAGTSADNARTDIKKAMNLFTAANLPLASAVLIMSESNAFALATALSTQSVPINPGLTAKGGTLLGVTVVTSQTAGNTVALVSPPNILFADDGGVNIDVSREATLEMNTTPTSPATASTTYVNLWQQNLIGLRAERFLNWKRARTTAVVYTTQGYL